MAGGGERRYSGGVGCWDRCRGGRATRRHGRRGCFITGGWIVKRRLLVAALAGYFLLSIAVVLVIAQLRTLGNEGPEQPIDFSHEIHVTKVGLQCTRCHTTVETSRFAGVPPVKTCMDCHKEAATDRPEIKKLREYWDEERPIEWVRVHDLPWHVYFSHKRHVKAGVACAECHGEVKVQSRIRQVRSLKMGWCVSCHESREASTDCWTCHK
ncbi:MAG: hypothetical protein GF355_16680 [Candidatus Eisenbacteria bacterium]|nr:hypothetical protein [Candidatus Eisenbacteria bacterium]